MYASWVKYLNLHLPGSHSSRNFCSSEPSNGLWLKKGIFENPTYRIRPELISKYLNNSIISISFKVPKLYPAVINFQAMCVVQGFRTHSAAPFHGDQLAVFAFFLLPRRLPTRLESHAKDGFMNGRGKGGVGGWRWC